MILKFSTNVYSTQTYQYSWIISLTFLHGIEPGVIVAVLWFVIYLIIIIYEVFYFDRSPITFVFNLLQNLINSYSPSILFFDNLFFPKVIKDTNSS